MGACEGAGQCGDGAGGGVQDGGVRGVEGRCEAGGDADAGGVGVGDLCGEVGG